MARKLSQSGFGGFGMKYLKLDARHHECHGLARALVGSPCGEAKDYHLQAVFNSKVGWTFGCYDYEDKYFGFLEEIEMPLDTLKLCPFVAMRERIPLYYSVDNGRWLHSFRCTVDKIEIGESGFCLYTRVDGDVFDTHISTSGFLSIDLDNLPQGAEIVEVD